MVTRKQPKGYREHKAKPLSHYIRRIVRKATGGKKKSNIRKVKLS